MQQTMKLLLSSILMLIASIATSQTDHPQDFRHPLDIPLLLSGTFGELRADHFHSGIDIKTQKRQGLKVYSVGDGHVSRIKVSLWGFGKALYVTHPNGYTSVYAHLQKFSPEIEAYVKKRQYTQEVYELELFPTPDELTFSKGDVIAFSGNSGGSGGPHLHFEIRDTSTEKPINPLLFGMEVKDSRKPLLQAAFAYPLHTEAQVNQSNKLVSLNFKPNADGIYVADKIYATGKVGFGINSYDRQDLAYNKNGVYKVTTFLNGNPKFSYDFETFSFGETRYINTLIDYARYKQKKQRVQRLFKTPANVLSIYDNADDGIFEFQDGHTYDIKIEILDFHGNMTTLVIPVEGKKMETLHPEKVAATDKFVIAGRDNLYQVGNASVFFPKNTFYENFYADIKKSGDTLYVHDITVPVRKRYTISMDVSKHAEAEKEKLFIANLTNKGEPSYNRTYKKGNTFSTRMKTLGTFFLEKDTVAPTVVPANFKEGKWLSNYNYLRVKVQDDLSGIKTYKGTIDGMWILFEYEPKTKMLTYNFSDKRLEGTKHLLEMVVTDNVGNSTTFTSTFFRKE